MEDIFSYGLTTDTKLQRPSQVAESHYCVYLLLSAIHGIIIRLSNMLLKDNVSLELLPRFW